MSEKKIDELSPGFESLTTEAAADILKNLQEPDMQLWMFLAENFTHAPTALMNIVKKAEAKLPEGILGPTEREKVLFMSGAMPPSARVVEIAIWIANDPATLEQFEQFAKPVIAENERSLVEALTAQYGTRSKKVLS